MSKLALFFAKRRGFLPFFYTKSEEAFLTSSLVNPDSNGFDAIKFGIVALDEEEKRSVLQKKPPISAIILTKDNTKKLARCIDAIKSSSYDNLEILIVTNSEKKETVEFLNNTGFKVIRYELPFNYSKMNNLGASIAKGDYLLFLNDDVEAINNDWIESMLSFAVQEGVGIVGALLFFPKSFFYPDTIQHAGVLIGIAGPAVHAFSFSHGNVKHYHDLDKTSRKVSAVTGACMMTRKRIFEEISGFDEKFSIVFGDTDLCLRIRKKGYGVIFDAEARLYHYESSTRGITYPLEDEIHFLNRWEDVILKGDEFYDQVFSRIHRDFSPCPTQTDIPALSLLLEIYFFREDLQKRFPKMSKENHQELVNWAAIEGVTQDSARDALVPFNRYYLENSSQNLRPLAHSIYKFNHESGLQKMFPEVFLGNYERLSHHTSHYD